MKAIAKRRFLFWCTLLIGCAALIGFRIHKVYRKSFETHVTICTRIPHLANFSWMSRIHETSLDELVERDEFAYNKFTECFSHPVRVTTWDNGAILYLTRVWKAKEGYLILTSGRDPIDYEMRIRYESEMPRIVGEPFAGVVEMTTVTRAFLDNYKLVMIPIGPKGVSVQQTDSSYSLDGQIVEQAGTGQPATRPESKSEGGDKPQSDAEGRSR